MDLEMLKKQREEIKRQIKMKSSALRRLHNLAGRWSSEISEMRIAHDALDRKIFIEDVGITVVDTKKEVKKRYKKCETLEEKIAKMKPAELRAMISSLEKRTSFVR